ncbi:MAG: hypothetical protein F6K24_37325, partial [Okeania sp. SIO2D1]|nr:hypothetical protein [Okeania sp. SIO2D1]
ETLSYIRRAGYSIWYNPQMLLWHHISSKRLQRSYLLKISQSIGLNRYPLRMLHYQPWQRPLMSLAYFINDFKRLVQYFWQNQRDIRRGDLVAQCELNLHSYSLLGAWYFWRQRHRKLTIIRTEIIVNLLGQKRANSRNFL